MISDIIIHKKGRGEGAISAPLSQEPRREPAQDPPGAHERMHEPPGPPQDHGEGLEVPTISGSGPIRHPRKGHSYRPGKRAYRGAYAPGGYVRPPPRHYPTSPAHPLRGICPIVSALEGIRPVLAPARVCCSVLFSACRPALLIALLPVTRTRSPVEPRKRDTRPVGHKPPQTCRIARPVSSGAKGATIAPLAGPVCPCSPLF